MNYLIPIGELLQYLLFSILVGTAVLEFIPAKKKPEIHIPGSLQLLSALGIVVVAFFPLLPVIWVFKERADLVSAAYMVISGTQVGRAWAILCLLGILLWITLYVNASKWFKAQLIILMIFAIGNSGHAASLSLAAGGWSHSIHFLMVTIWVGVLLAAGWFSKSSDNWREFLRWFSPLAATCFAVTLVTGFLLMKFTLNGSQYIASWALPYGRILLLKHLSIIPALAFALINGFLAKRMRMKENFEPRAWIKAEGIVLMMVFFFTGILGTLPPPHETEAILPAGTTLAWMDWILLKDFFSAIPIEWAPSIASVMMMGISALFLLLVFISFKKSTHLFAMVFAGCFIIVIYFGMMFSVRFGQDEKFTLRPLTTVEFQAGPAKFEGE